MNLFSLNDLCLRMHRVRPFRYRGPLFTRESIQSSEGLSASLRATARSRELVPPSFYNAPSPFYAQQTPHRRGAPIVDKAQVAREERG
ncbi:hypothetical protein B0H16DRAFT_1711067 [Mycena metata]|uniref:Uncharacterized protein n=1 Tax=Mycena metata TaxID=1033252 RepID=A0AAD7K7I3_9AGAR|nr:hypothetical protein B0H16DRAFT_1711067 [Mycena metata]